MTDLTLEQIDWIAVEATRRIQQAYDEHGWYSPRQLSAGDVRAVLEAAETLRAEETDGGSDG